jgi:hypothetical protein
MYIQRKDIEKILSVMDDFLDAKSYKLESDSSSGIGSVLTLTMDTKVNNRDVLVTVEISSVEDW